VPRYLVEAYVPRALADGAGAEERRMLDAAKELAREGVAVAFIRTTSIPDDDTCFHVVDADSIEAVRELCSRAGLNAARVVEAVEHSRGR
jgi:hypothetical protein